MANTAINHDPVATFPGSSTNTAVVKWSGTSGNALLDSGVLIDASNNVTGLNNVTATGYLHLTGDEKELRFYEGANYIAIAAPSGLGADYTFTLPLNDGSADEFLQTNGSGVLTWAAAAGTTINSNADNRVITGSGTANTLNGESELTYPYAGQLKIINAGGGVIFWLDGSTGQAETRYNNAGTTKWTVGMDADGASNQKSHVDDFAFYSSGGYGVVISGEGTNKFGIGTQAGIALSSAEIPDGGIQFPATHVANASANNLDEYEEGTFTPTIADNDLNASESQAYHTQVGRYVRIGRMVHCQIILHTSSIGNLTTSHGVKILGLPFSSVNSGATVGGGSVYIATSMSITSGTNITVDVPSNVAYCRLQNFDASSGTSTFLLSEWGGTGNILLSLTYEAA
jgi:hypothetical protein